MSNSKVIASLRKGLRQIVQTCSTEPKFQVFFLKRHKPATDPCFESLCMVSTPSEEHWLIDHQSAIHRHYEQSKLLYASRPFKIAASISMHVCNCFLHRYSKIDSKTKKRNKRVSLAETAALLGEHVRHNPYVAAQPGQVHVRVVLR